MILIVDVLKVGTKISMVTANSVTKNVKLVFILLEIANLVVMIYIELINTLNVLVVMAIMIPLKETALFAIPNVKLVKIQVNNVLNVLMIDKMMPNVHVNLDTTNYMKMDNVINVAIIVPPVTMLKLA